MYETLYLSYDEWKALKTSLSATAYYIQQESFYTLAIVDLSRKTVYRSEVMRDPSADQTTLTDFETNIKPTAVQHNSLDDAIADEIIP